MHRNRWAVDRIVRFQRMRIKGMWWFHIVVAGGRSGNGAGAQTRDQRLAQADELSHAPAGVHAGIFNDVPEFRQTITGQVIVPVLDSLNELFDVLSDFIPDIITLLG